MRQKLLIIAAVAAGLAGQSTLAQEPKQPAKEARAVIGTVERLDPRFDKLIPKDAQLEQIAEGFIWSEGAVWYKPGKCLLFSDIPNNVVIKWEPGKGTSEFLKPSGYTGVKPRGGKAGDEPGSNGLFVDAQGRLYLCEHGDRRVTRIEKNGKKTVLADNYMGKKLNSPNDLALHPNGDVYFTDPPYGLAKGDKRELDFTGVFRISGKDGKLSLVSKSLNPNGIALSPDLKKLYVTNGGSWMVFPVNADGTTGAGKVFVNTKQWNLASAQGGGLDGMKCDAQGNIFATGPGGVCVIAPDGTLLGRLLTGDRTANLCFGGEDGRTLFVCVNHRIGMVRTTTRGIDLSTQRPYAVFPPADPPYYRVRYEASKEKGELVYPVNCTIWIPQGVKSLRGVIVHQHGCGEGSCKSGLTGAYDLHWQVLARKHDCALLSPSYEQPDKADCQMWCDPRNGSDAAFQKCLVDLGAKSGHPELAKVPWALWGHSGGGHWAGGMVMLHPDRVAAAWLRSGVPQLTADPKRTAIKAHALPDAALKVPIMCNLGTKEGVTVKNGPFAGVWPANQAFFNKVRGKGGLVGVAIDPLSSHECGNQRYLAIPWLDACLSARLPKTSGDPLNAMPTDKAWLAPITGTEAVSAASFIGEPLKLAWLPNKAIAKSWMQYVKDTKIIDATPPPAPTHVRLKGNELTWQAEADLESGLASFIIERDGKFLAKVPQQGKNPFGRPVFQNLQYSDTPTQPLVQMRYVDAKAEPGKKHTYRVIAVNTMDLQSMPSVDSVADGR